MARRLFGGGSARMRSAGHANNDRYDCWANPLSLVFYNPRRREWDDEEANELQGRLEAAGFKVNRKIWTTKHELRQLITATVRGMERCSLLFVCIMSHGRAGALKTTDGDGDSAMIINDVLHQFNTQLGEKFAQTIPIGELESYFTQFPTQMQLMSIFIRLLKLPWYYVTPSFSLIKIISSCKCKSAIMHVIIHIA